MEFLDDYDAIQYYFMTNFLSYDYITDLQLMMRFSIKLDYTYSEFLTPVMFLGWQATMNKVEEERERERNRK